MNNYLLAFSAILLLGLLAQVSGIIQYTDAQNVDVEVGVEAEIGAGGESETSSETKAEGSADVESSENKSTMTESSTAMETKSHTSSSYPKISANSESQIVIQSKQIMYQPGDTITVEGSLWTTLASQLGQSSIITIQLLDSEGNIVNEKTAKASSDGRFDSQIGIPPTVASGEYTLRSEIVVDSTVLSALGGTNTVLETSTTIIVSVPTIVTVSAKEHGNFEVGIASSSDVSRVEFSAQEKTLAFQVEGETGTKGVTQITIPKQLLSGQITVLIDGQVMANDDIIMTADTETETEFELNYSHSVHTIEMVGTNAVPEFGQIAAMILTVSLVSIVVVFRTRFKQNLAS